MSQKEDILDYKRRQIETKSIPQNELWLFHPLPETTPTCMWQTFVTGFLDQQGVDVLRSFYSPEDVELLSLFGRWLNALHVGYDEQSDARLVIKPQNEVEEHFALVSHGRQTPIYYFEEVWLSFYADQAFLRLVKNEKHGDSDWRNVLIDFLELADRGDRKAKQWVKDYGGREEIIANIGTASKNPGILGIYGTHKQVRG